MKGNFNLPKRAPGPYGYSGDMESWEFQNNTSDLMLFKTDYFDETLVTDPTTGEAKAAWLYDYEARFPDDTWTDYSKLQEFESFIVACDPAKASDATDRAARVQRFRDHFGDYAEVDSFLFYYIFTELFLMVDSRAKNLFIGFSGGATTGLTAIDRKAVAEPYDMDTSIGINNEGSLVFGYSLEDTDHLAGGANVFNGQDSVLWCLVREAFPVEIQQMYQQLRSQGKLSYPLVESRFEEHQSKWPEAIFNEDAKFKYIDPLVNPEPGKEPTTAYLAMAQGSKAEQRKWWLYNRFRYMDSKWNAGDALSDVIQLRGYAKSNITVTPYADIYPAVKYGSYLVTERGSAGNDTTLTCPLDAVNDTEIYIYSASQLSSVGDLSGLKVGFADFSMATKLTSIKVGTGTQGYENPNLTTLYVGQNPMLEDVDARNCSALTGTVDLSGAANLHSADFSGTAVNAVTLPVGGNLRYLTLPDTVTNLTIREQPNLDGFQMLGSDPYDNITTLRVENSHSSIPVLDILQNIAANSRVRLIGFTMTVSTTQQVEDFFDELDTMRGMDESGNNLTTAVVSGTITGLGTITGAWLAQMNARYPDVRYVYEHITSTLSYYSWDGETLIESETISDNGNGTYSGSPSRTATAQYSYTFIGWSLYTDQYTADANATKSVGADRSVYAAYSRTVQTYTVTWKNADNTTLETDTGVAYGSMPTYNGTTPTYNGQTSTGWTPAVSAVTGDVTYTASYVPVYRCRFYSGSSSSSAGTLLATIQVQQGSTAVYSGTTPTSSTQGFEFKGWDKPLTDIQAATDFYAQYRDTRAKTIQYLEGTMEEYSSDTATKIARNKMSYSRSLISAETTATSIEQYAFSNSQSLEVVDLKSTSAATIATYAFMGDTKLKHLIIRSSTMSTLADTNAFSSTQIEAWNGAIYVPAALVDTYRADSKWSNYFITSIDNYPTTDYSTISDSWLQIIAAAEDGTASSKYSVGDTKLLDLGTEGQVYMQIAGFNKDVLSSDTSKTAGISFISKQVMRGKSMNDTATTTGGWADSALRSYLADSMLPLVPSDVASAIKQVNKTYYDYNDSVTETTSDKLWIPSSREVVDTVTSKENSGCEYDELFTSDAITRIKYTQSGSADSWWLRTTASDNTFRYVRSNGGFSSYNAGSPIKIVIGFCI